MDCCLTVLGLGLWCLTPLSGAVVAVIVWQFDLQLPMQSMPITTDVVGLTPAQGEVYNFMW